MKNKMILPARFVSFEGIDGCGKSTLISQLSNWLAKAEIQFVETREPGGTTLGENIRSLLLDPKFHTMNQRAEVLLYTASRAQLAHEVIYPALGKGLWVLTDRYIDATLAYQGYGRGLDLENLRLIQEWATGSLWPHTTILLDCDVDTALQRQRRRNNQADRIEQEDRSFHERVRNGYLALAKSEPQRFIVLDAGKPLPAVIQHFHMLFWQRIVENSASIVR